LKTLSFVARQGERGWLMQFANLTRGRVIAAVVPAGCASDNDNNIESDIGNAAGSSTDHPRCWCLLVSWRAGRLLCVRWLRPYRSIERHHREELIVPDRR